MQQNHTREAKANAAKAQTRSRGQLLNTGIILPKRHEQIHRGKKEKQENGYFVLSKGSATLPWDLGGWKMEKEDHVPMYIGFTKLA